MTQTFKITNGDWVLNKSNGRPTMVKDREKLRQDVREDLCVATQITGFGAGLESRLGQDVDPFAFRLDISRNIRKSITTIQQLQDQFLSSKRADTERIEGISSLSVNAVNLGGGTAKTGYSFKLSVKPVAGDTFTVGGTVAG